MRRWGWLLQVGLVALAGVRQRALAQSPSGGLENAAERVRQAWLAHDVTAIVAGSPGVTLRIPGADPSAAINANQAAELLRRYLQSAVERSAEASTVREVETGQGFAELTRRYVVRGTSDPRQERVFVGFRKDSSGRWVVVELRVGH